MQTAPHAPMTRLVVVIDDDPVIREAMDGLLRSWGYQVLTAASSEAALALLGRDQQRPDLIISDFDLADGKTGIEAIERLRGAFDIPALLISGSAEPARSQQGRARYHVLYKPVDPAALQAMLKRLIAGEA